MPIPWVPIIAGGAQLLGEAFNVGSQRRTNREQRDFAISMYNRQRQDALSDRAFENFYNSPAEQMKRLKEAHLNPHLVYGHGAVTQGESTRGANAQGYSPKAPELGMGFVPQLFMMIYDLAQKQATTDNIRASTENTKAQTGYTHVRTTREGLGVNWDIRTLQERVTQEMLRRRNMEEDISLKSTEQMITFNRDQREAIMNSQNVAESVARVLQIEAQTANTKAERDRIEQQIQLLKLDKVVRALDAYLATKGVRPGENYIFRKAQQGLNWIQNLWKGLINIK